MQYTFLRLSSTEGAVEEFQNQQPLAAGFMQGCRDVSVLQFAYTRKVSYLPQLIQLLYLSMAHPKHSILGVSEAIWENKS